MKYEALIRETEMYVTELYRVHTQPELIYHSIVHTREVVQAAEQIAAHYQLNEEDLAVIYIAAWFHDVGYLFGPPDQHEMTGGEKAAEFLKGHGVDPGMIEKVRNCILATRLPQSPKNLLEEIICDADLFHLGTDNFREKSKLMRKERALILGTEINGSEWREGTIQFLESHHYFTDYVKTLLNKTKSDNLDGQKRKLEKKHKAREEKEQEVMEDGFDDELKLASRDDKKSKEDLPTRGVETMFRLTSSNHLDLSSMADSKANIMISVNSIIVSVLVSVLLRHLEDFPNLVLPFIIFLTVNVCTIIFAVLATRPNVTKGVFTREDIQQKRANLLFFGNFHKMKLQDYEWGMKEMMQDRDFLYGSMIRDIYFLGLVLGKKYRLLRISYNIFMFGFVIASLSFAIAVLFFPS